MSAMNNVCQDTKQSAARDAGQVIDGSHEDYRFENGPAPDGAKQFGFDGSGQFNAKIACIAYSGTICNPIRGIDIRGNYWCASAVPREVATKNLPVSDEGENFYGEMMEDVSRLNAIRLGEDAGISAELENNPWLSKDLILAYLQRSETTLKLAGFSI